jgi:hypothetical protein
VRALVVYCTSYTGTIQRRKRLPCRRGHANFGTANLSDVDDGYYYGVSCQSCLRSAPVSLVRLRGILGGDYPVVNVARRMKCRTCGSKRITVTFLTPHQAVGNLAYQ